MPCRCREKVVDKAGGGEQVQVKQTKKFEPHTYGTDMILENHTPKDDEGAKVAAADT